MEHVGIEGALFVSLSSQNDWAGIRLFQFGTLREALIYIVGFVGGTVLVVDGYGVGSAFRDDFVLEEAVVVLLWRSDLEFARFFHFNFSEDFLGPINIYLLNVFLVIRCFQSTFKLHISSNCFFLRGADLTSKTIYISHRIVPQLLTSLWHRNYLFKGLCSDLK